MKHLTLVLMLIAGIAAAQQRFVTPSDVYKLKSVGDPQPSPDGKWIAYVVSTPDSAKDKYDTDIWMVSRDGSENIRLTTSPESEGSPRWSPDNKYLTFLSSRYESKASQIWILNRRGGEASKLTELKYSISSYFWSPDAKKIALLIADQESVDEVKKTTKPIAIDRYHFKSDGEGYLERKYTHIYLFDVASKQLDTLTKGSFDHAQISWSPDSKQIAFVSNQTADPDRNGNTDIFVMEAKKGGAVSKLTTWQGADESPSWSPDGKYIAYKKSQFATFDIYDQAQLAVIAAAGGEPKIINPTLDRNVSDPKWSADSKSIFVTVEDDRRTHIASFDLNGKKTMHTSGDRIFYALQRNDNTMVAIESNPSNPGEVCLIEQDKVTQLTHVFDDYMKDLKLSTPQPFTSKSKDGTLVNGLLYLPSNSTVTKNLPLILWIHGGPTSQDDFSFDFIPQIFASRGYAVATVNYRGSSGRGLAYSRAIYGDWGNKEVMDLLGSVDHLVKTGVADPNQLSLGGWSYGGILTDYITATDQRFKAAASGAGSALQLSMYGSDQYILQYETELGQPWKNMDKWMKVSYPFFKADRIKTPTLYMVGEKDFNVPAAGSEQMYQALKSLGVPTQLVIYPNQFHGIRTPSYQKDRLSRYLDWFGRYTLSPVLSSSLPPKQ